MPISGPIVHQQLMDAYVTTQTQLESARGQITQSKQQRDQLDDHRGDALVTLAEYYLPALTDDAVRQTWIDVRASLSKILQRKENHCRQIQTELDSLSARRQTQDQQLIAINQKLDQAIENQQSLTVQVGNRLRDDDEFVRLCDRAAVAEAALERAESNLHEIDQDAARKLPAYDNSALFRYLKDRGFGTSQYSKRGFTRRMDRWVAKLIDYGKAKKGYEFLKKTPEQMRQIIADDRQALDTVMDELERRRDKIAAELGLPAQIAEARKLAQQRDELLAALDEVLVQADKKQQELTAADDSRGPYYREAIAVFRDMLRRVDSQDLKRRAEATVDITDDQIVARLMGVESEISMLDEAARRRRTELLRMQSFLEDLGQLIQRFRAAGFDSSRSQFVGSLDILDELDRARDAGNIDLLWQHVRNSQRWGPTTMEQITQVASHPMTQILINAMAHAAGGALEAHARRAGYRRSQRDSKWGNPWSGGSSSGFNWRRR